MNPEAPNLTSKPGGTGTIPEAARVLAEVTVRHLSPRGHAHLHLLLGAKRSFPLRPLRVADGSRSFWISFTRTNGVRRCRSTSPSTNGGMTPARMSHRSSSYRRGSARGRTQ